MSTMKSLLWNIVVDSEFDSWLMGISSIHIRSTYSPNVVLIAKQRSQTNWKEQGNNDKYNTLVPIQRTDISHL